MSVFEEAFTLGGPDDNSVVGTTRCKSLPIFRIGDAVNGIFMTLKLVHSFTSVDIIHEDKVSYGYENLITVWSEAHCPDLVCLFDLGWRHWNLVLPPNYGTHI